PALSPTDSPSRFFSGNDLVANFGSTADPVPAFGEDQTMARPIVAACLLAAMALVPQAISAEPDERDYACVAATGEKIPHPGSRTMYAVEDGDRTVRVPQGMVYVPAGPFPMGEGESRHDVTLDAFCIGKYEVTNAEWKDFTDATGHRPLPR